MVFSVVFFDQVREMKKSMTGQVIRAKQQHILDEQFNLYVAILPITFSKYFMVFINVEVFDFSIMKRNGLILL